MQIKPVYTLFADESGTSSSEKCYTIGCVLIPAFMVDDFRSEILSLIEVHNLPDQEYKWTRIKNNYGIINFMIDILRLILESDASFICKVVWKEHYRNWRGHQETAFYKTYTNLIEYCARIFNTNIKAKIDDKQDAYDKHHEVVQIIANHKLKDRLGSIDNVERCDSKSEILIQVADLLTGAINASHNLFLNRDAQLNSGKRLAISKLAETIGWDALHYDTFPNASFNIWHFPMKEFRNNPATRKIVQNFNVSYLTPDTFR